MPTTKETKTREMKNQQESASRENFIKTKQKQNLLHRTKKYLEAGFPVHFTGPSGVGKTSLAIELARQINRPVVMMHGNHEMSNTDLIGGFTGYSSKKVIDNYVRTVYKREENVNENWSPGRLLDAVKNGYILIYDEFTRSKPETNNLFLSVLEEGILPIYGAKQKETFIKVHPDFKMIFTSNPKEYAGVYHSQDALMDRLISIPIGAEEVETETEMLAKKVGISYQQASLIVRFVSRIRKLCKEKKKQGPSFRIAVMIAEICKTHRVSIRKDNPFFIDICGDVTGSYVSQCKGIEELEKTKKWIQQEIQSLKGKDG